MPIAIRNDCPCCVLSVHHCESCWNKFHNGEKHKDFEPPEYFGQPFFSEEVVEEVNKELGRESKVKPDKNRKYAEGDYNHGS